jgi:hypothetical protein
MRTTLARMAAAAAMLTIPSMGAVAQPVHVQVNGQPVYFEGTQPRTVDGRVLVPLRGVLEKMGAHVDWDPSRRVVTASRSGIDLTLPIGSTAATVNGSTVWLDVPARTYGGYTMVPLRFVGEALGADVAWLNDTQTVSINTDRQVATNRQYRMGDQSGDRYYRPHGNGTVTRNPDQRRSYRVGRRIVVPSGTVLPVRLDDQLSSDGSRDGDRFTASVESGASDLGLPSGTKFEGIVTEAIPAGNGKPGVLALDVRRIVFASGDTQTVDAGITSLDSKDISRSSSGRLVARNTGNRNEQWKWVGIGAGAGLLISTLVKGNQFLDTILGAGAGYLYNQLQRKGASNVNLKPGTEIGVLINRQFAANPARG